MAIMISTSLSNPAPPPNLSSLGSISGRIHIQFLPTPTRFSQLSLTTTTTNTPFKTTTIRMGGGPRTYPGGVSKWQWKRMQAKKAKQLLKARLARERQIYEMRKRAELKAAVSELERPWEVVEKAPTLFSVSADEQLKVLADRFQRPCGFDMWSDRDGPELFKPDSGLPSARFFPKGVVHSVKPYGKIEKFDDGSDESGCGNSDDDDDIYRQVKNEENNLTSHAVKNSNKSLNGGKSEMGSKNKFRKNYNKTSYSSDSTEVGYLRGSSGRNHRPSDSNVKQRRPSGVERTKDSKSVVFDMTLHKDGSYELRQNNRP
ncbi:hypothetical protein ACH5RR_005282 [Cinchona calisaya]|uniref:Uncharacterized protein n=1 Tax=Cinchona calisaya TaxID=153742 RepID=A0ABD3AKT3_9GENT